MSRDGQAVNVADDLNVAGTINGENAADDAVLGDASNETHVGQLNHPTHVKGNLQVVQNLGVGPTNGAGSIDARGTPTAQNLKIGSGNSTGAVELGRTGQNVKVVGTLSMNNDVDMNSNDLRMDSVAAGSGMRYNAAGQNPGHPSLDFFIAGVVSYYIDDDGGHNV